MRGVGRMKGLAGKKSPLLSLVTTLRSSSKCLVVSLCSPTDSTTPAQIHHRRLQAVHDSENHQRLSCKIRDCFEFMQQRSYKDLELLYNWLICLSNCQSNLSSSQSPSSSSSPGDQAWTAVLLPGM